MMQSVRSGLSVVAVFTFIAALCWYGLGYQVGVSSARAQDDYANGFRQLPVITRAAQLDSSLIGQRVLVEGTVAADNSTYAYADHSGQQRLYVIYRTDRIARGTPDANGITSLSYTKEREATPVVRIQLEGGTAQVANTNYLYDSPPTGSGTYDPDYLIRGYAVDDPVLVDGTVLERGGALVVEASRLTSRSSDAYVASHTDQRGRPIYVFLGQALAGLGTICLILALLLLGIAWRSHHTLSRTIATQPTHNGKRGIV